MSSDHPSGDPSAAADAAAALLEALQRHSQSARDHAESTATYAFAAAAEVGLGRDECELVRVAARLHEVGLLYSDSATLGTSQEETYRLARGAGVDEEVCRWLLRTRERFDGTGPEELAGEAIPVQSRLIRAACVFHAAATEPAPGDDGPPHSRGLDRIRTQAGSELDPEVVAAVVTAVERAAV
jgi:HD-GYP domain-containing protein (c-di-GMP phosphodiesterase class II)